MTVISFLDRGGVTSPEWSSGVREVERGRLASDSAKNGEEDQPALCSANPLALSKEGKKDPKTVLNS
ncbi:hypothetical protein X777_13416 [Ooceraea biroi]|uniref:Uncharacterized protein n=1 Tax=Ooceraea biroi TaxID=2015173 RepID=A0A026WWA7_OOCBI|nr:hypothetical protein X777_13416 [Ooceraea biroi]